VWPIDIPLIDTSTITSNYKLSFALAMYILLSSEITYQLISFFVVGDYNFVEATINPNSHKNRRKSISLIDQETSEQFSSPRPRKPIVAWTLHIMNVKMNYYFNSWNHDVTCYSNKNWFASHSMERSSQHKMNAWTFLFDTNINYCAWQTIAARGWMWLSVTLVISTF